MTWQEELRKLDEELAAGRITADDYRVRRDQVLSSAVAPGEQGEQPQDQQAPGDQQVPGQEAHQQASPPQPGPQPGFPPQGPPAAGPQAGQPPHGPGAGFAHQPPPYPQDPQQAPGSGFAPQQPVQPQQPQGPHPQGPQPQGQAPQGHGQQVPPPDSTQFIAPGQAGPAQPGPAQTPPGQGPPADAPQAAPGWHGAGWQGAGWQGGAPVSGQPASPPGGFPAAGQQNGFTGQPGYPQPGQPQGGYPSGYDQTAFGTPTGFDQQQHGGAPWSGTDEDAAPPWGGDFPPLSPGSDSEWGVRQGPEKSGDGSSSKKGKTILTIAGAVLLVAIAGFAVWFFALSGNGGDGATPNNNASGGSAQNTTEQPKPKTLNEIVPAPPGNADKANGKMSISEGVQSGQLTAGEATALKDAGIEEILFKGSADGDFTYETIALEADDPKTAKQIVKTMENEAEKTGMVPGAQGELPKHAKVTQRVQEKVGMYRVAIAEENRVVRVAVTQEPLGENDKKLITKFQRYAVSVSENVAS